MEYSIFQNFAYFCCVPFFLEYSWNIPYSNILDNFVVAVFVWNIPYSKSPEKTLWTKKLGIFHIPSKGKKRCGMKKLEYSMFRFQRLKFWVTYKMEYFLGTKKSEILTLPPQYLVSIGEHLPPTYCVILQRVRIFQVWIFTYAFRRLAYLIIVIFPSFLRACLSCVLSLFLGNFFSACGEPLLPWYYLKLFSRLRRAQYSCDTGL